MLRLRAHALALVNVLLAALLLAGLGTSASAAFPPRPDGPVYDGANIISPATEAALDRQLRDYNAQTGRAIVVATVPNLDGQPVEKYATELFGTWGVGGAKRDQGLLLLVARDDRKMRIEVGYGLHPYFGGIMAGRVIRDVITPRFKEGDFDGGITSGVDAILTHLARSPADAAAIEEAAQAAEQERRENAGPVIGGAIFWVVLIIFFISIFGRRRRGFRRGSGFGSAVGNIILWEALNAATRGASRDWGDGGGGFGGFGGGGGGGFGGFGGGMSGGGGASGSW